MRRVFTNPENKKAPWPYINTNPFSLGKFKRYVEEFGDEVKAVLMDTGVHTIFSDPAVKDYPPAFIPRYISAIREVARIVERFSDAELYWVIPDIPVDYPGRDHYYPWNVKRTVEYVRYFLSIRDHLPGTPIAVVQGRHNDPKSTVKAYLDYYDVYGEFDYLGLGPTCTSRDAERLSRQIMAFDAVVHTRFHAFGVHTNVLKRIRSACMLASIDSSSYMYDIMYRFGRRKTAEEMARVMLFRVSRLQSLLESIPCIRLRL